MIELVSDAILEPDVEDLIVFNRDGRPTDSVGLVAVRRHGEHPIADAAWIGSLAYRILGDGYVWTCLLTGNGGAVDSRDEALAAILSEALTEYPTTDRRPSP